MHPHFDRDGYLVVPGFKSRAELAVLRARAVELVQAFDPASTRTVFTTRDQDRQVDDYFLSSAHAVRSFFEEEAFDEQGRLKQDKTLSINKIGHSLHDLDPVFDRFSHGAALADAAQQAGLRNRATPTRCTRPTLGPRMPARIGCRRQRPDRCGALSERQPTTRRSTTRICAAGVARRATPLL